MTRQLNQAQLLAREEIVRSPGIPSPRACNDHSFELPAGIYAAMGLFFAGAIAVLALAFRENLGVTYAVILALLTAYFGIPAIFVKVAPGEGRKALSWRQFQMKGIRTATGLTGPREATVLVLALPFLILSWAIAVATIAALVN
jgi:hypothetical protein